MPVCPIKEKIIAGFEPEGALLCYPTYRMAKHLALRVNGKLRPVSERTVRAYASAFGMRKRYEFVGEGRARKEWVFWPVIDGDKVRDALANLKESPEYEGMISRGEILERLAISDHTLDALAKRDQVKSDPRPAKDQYYGRPCVKSFFPRSAFEKWEKEFEEAELALYCNDCKRKVKKKEAPDPVCQRCRITISQMASALEVTRNGASWLVKASGIVPETRRVVEEYPKADGSLERRRRPLPTITKGEMEECRRRRRSNATNETISETPDVNPNLWLKQMVKNAATTEKKPANPKHLKWQEWNKDVSKGGLGLSHGQIAIKEKAQGGDEVTREAVCLALSRLKKK